MFVAVANAWAKFAINAQQQQDGGGIRSGIRIRIGSVNSFVNATRQQLSVSLFLTVLSPVACLWIWFVFLLCHSARGNSRDLRDLPWTLSGRDTVPWLWASPSSSPSRSSSVSFLGPFWNRLPAQSKQVITEIYMARFERAVIPMQISHNNNNNNNTNNNCR